MDTAFRPHDESWLQSMVASSSVPPRKSFIVSLQDASLCTYFHFILQLQSMVASGSVPPRKSFLVSLQDASLRTYFHFVLLATLQRHALPRCYFPYIGHNEPFADLFHPPWQHRRDKAHLDNLCPCLPKLWGRFLTVVIADIAVYMLRIAPLAPPRHS